MTSDVHSMH